MHHPSEKDAGQDGVLPKSELLAFAAWPPVRVPSESWRDEPPNDETHGDVEKIGGVEGLERMFAGAGSRVDGFFLQG